MNMLGFVFYGESLHAPGYYYGRGYYNRYYNSYYHKYDARRNSTTNKAKSREGDGNERS